MKYFEPWEHEIIDEFYDEALFLRMKQEIIDYVKANSKLISGINIINEIRELNLPLTKACIDSRPINEEWLKTFSEYREYESLKVENQIIICIGEQAEYRIHDERPEKILSAVLYITPDRSTGTLIYDQNKVFVKEVEWKPNTALIFPGITDKTWHNYKAGFSKIRITLNTFLVKS